MNITKAKYYSSKKDVIEAVIDGKSLDVPTDDIGNRHYAEIVKQQKDGTLTIEDAD
jgi:hypothetical protein